MSEDRPPNRGGSQPNEPVESRGMASRQRNIRMEDSLWDAATEEAERQGMSTSEFLREATMFRLGYLAAVDHGAATREIEAMLRRISERATD
jgi:hypothetical protein